MGTNREKINEYLNNLYDVLQKYEKGLSSVQMQMGDLIEDLGNEKQKQISKKISSEEVKKLEAEHSKQMIEGLKKFIYDENSLAYKEIMKCYRYWVSHMMPALKKMGISAFMKMKIDVYPHVAKLANFLFLNGDYYKGLHCLYDLIYIYPSYTEPRSNYYRWLLFLGEWELAEESLAIERKLRVKFAKQTQSSSDSRLRNIAEISAEFLEFNRKETSREKTSENMLKHLEESKNLISNNTFISTEYYALIHYLCSFLSKTANPAEAVPDSLHLLHTSFCKFETIMRNRVPGLSKDQHRIDITRIFDDPASGLEAACSIAKCLEIMRELVIENFNCGLIKEAFSYAYTGLKYCLKLGIVFRVQQFLNLYLLIQTNVASKDYLSAVPTTLYNLSVLYEMSKPPKNTNSLFGCLSSNIPTPSIASKFLSEFQDLKISEKNDDASSIKTFHKVDKKCNCEICFLYSTNYNMAMEYHISCYYQDIYASKSYDSIECVSNAFFSIRERVISEQTRNLVKKGRPRPPLSISEAFLMVSVKWLRSLETLGKPYLRNTRIRTLRETIIDKTQKVTTYSSIRFIGYALALKHFKRMDKLCGRVDTSFPWMTPSEEAEKKAGVCKKLTLAFFGKSTDSPVGLKSEYDSSLVPFFMAKSGEALNKALNDAQIDYYEYGHLLYRDWRFPVTTFVGAHTDNKFRAAMMFSESTVLASRETARFLSGKLGGVTFESSTIFENGLKRLPSDFTIIQLTLDSDGNLFLIKMHAERSPIILPVAHYSKVNKASVRMTSIMEANEQSTNNFKPGSSEKNAKQFWAYRRKVDDMLQKTVIGVQNYLFQNNSPFLLPCLSLTAKGRKIADNLLTIVSESPMFDINIAQELVSIAAQISKQKWSFFVDGLAQMCGLSQQDIKTLQEEYAKLRKATEGSGIFNKSQPLYTFLIVPPILASFPFEVMPIFDNCPHVGRLVSVHALLMLLRKTTKLPQPVVVSNSYYILDPDNNLSSTQLRLSDYISKYPWTGVIGKPPSLSEFKNVLQEKDLLFYLGHGSGSRYFGKRAVQESSCKAVAVLMGCGSVAMDYEGWALDGKCTVYNYTIAKSPAVLGCLWMVTDGEIDRYFMALVDLCFSSDCNVTFEEGAPRLRVLLEGMQKARSRVKLPYLTGAAVISYGLPIVSSD